MTSYCSFSLVHRRSASHSCKNVVPSYFTFTCLLTCVYPTLETRKYEKTTPPLTPLNGINIMTCGIFGFVNDHWTCLLSLLFGKVILTIDVTNIVVFLYIYTNIELNKATYLFRKKLRESIGNISVYWIIGMFYYCDWRSFNEWIYIILNSDSSLSRCYFVAWYCDYL